MISATLLHLQQCTFLDMLTLLIALQVLVFHSLAFAIGYLMIRTSSPGSDGIPVARCISLETGMQVLCCTSIHVT